MPPQRTDPDNRYHVLASASSQRRPQALLNHADSFAIFDLAGDIPFAVLEPYGLFHRGTRFLNRFELHLNNAFPVLLNTRPTHEESELVTYLANADEHQNGDRGLEQATVAIQRRKTLFDATLYEHLQLHNHGQQPLRLELELVFGADFADLFELRGAERTRRGDLLAPRIGQHGIVLPYQGLDGVHRETAIEFSPAPYHLTVATAAFQLDLAPGEDTTLEVRIACHLEGRSSSSQTFASALTTLQTERQNWQNQFPVISSDNENFNAWLNRSRQDLAMLHTKGASGTYPYAGIPWFATIFGRDGLITAFETLGFAPDIAAGVLRTLAALQGQANVTPREEEPGKIIHELRHGEMAALGEVPFRRYYGSVDATPLFLLLLAQYAERTGDLALVRELWPAATAAMDWIDTHTGADGAGYVTYAPRTAQGLSNQGWKDSHDAISQADGTLATPPIALAEVQAYVYAARHGLAQVARRLERTGDAATWEAKARLLRERFNHEFWLEEEEIFALALDGEKRPCRVVSSNAGHCLFGGIAEPDQAPRIIARLMRDDMFCGWGIRTLSAHARRYNPMSYHNGSIWPHDNALIAAGFARYGATKQASQLLEALFEVGSSIENWRLPELFCGFPRNRDHSPVPYPVACKPQAWAAGSVFLLLQAVLGLEVDGWAQRITFNRTALPVWLSRLDIRGLRVGKGRVDIGVIRDRYGAAVEVMEKYGDVEIVVRK